MARTTEPIYSEKDFAQVMCYWKEKGDHRNFAILSILFLTALRVSDAVLLRWSDFFSDTSLNSCKACVFLSESKTGKRRQIDVTHELEQVLCAFKQSLREEGKAPSPGDYLFSSGRGKSGHISRTQVWRIVRKAGEPLGLRVSCHSLRKTFGHIASKKKNIHCFYPTYLCAFQPQHHCRLYLCQRERCDENIYCLRQGIRKRPKDAAVTVIRAFAQ